MLEELNAQIEELTRQLEEIKAKERGTLSPSYGKRLPSTASPLGNFAWIFPVNPIGSAVVLVWVVKSLHPCTPMDREIIEPVVGGENQSGSKTSSIMAVISRITELLTTP